MSSSSSSRSSSCSSFYKRVCEKQSSILSFLKSHPGSTAVDIESGVFTGDDVRVRLAIARFLNDLADDNKLTKRMKFLTTIWFLPGDEKKTSEKDDPSSSELQRKVKCVQCHAGVDVSNALTSKHCQADFSFCRWKCVGVHQRNYKVDETVKCIQCGTEDNRCKFSKVYRFGTSFLLCTSLCVNSFDVLTKEHDIASSSKRNPEEEKEEDEPPAKKAKKSVKCSDPDGKREEERQEEEKQPDVDSNLPVMIEIEVERDECLGRYFYRYAVPYDHINDAAIKHLQILSEYGCTSKKGLDKSRELIKSLCQNDWKEYLLKTTFDHNLSFRGFYHIQDDFFRGLHDDSDDDEEEEGDSDVCRQCLVHCELCECDKCDKCGEVKGECVCVCTKCDKCSCLIEECKCLICTRCKLSREKCNCKCCDECSELIDDCVCSDCQVTMCPACDKPKPKDAKARVNDNAFCDC